MKTGCRGWRRLGAYYAAQEWAMAVAAAMAAGYHRSGGHGGYARETGSVTFAEWRLCYSLGIPSCFRLRLLRQKSESATSKSCDPFRRASSHATLSPLTDEWFLAALNGSLPSESRSGFSVSPSQVVTSAYRRASVLGSMQDSAPGARRRWSGRICSAR